MDIYEYQRFAAQGIRKESEGKNLLIGFALGLAGETGEVLDAIKKREYHGRVSEYPVEHIAEELGDVMWYVCNLATQLGYTVEEILTINYDKLQQRYPELYKRRN